jgi:hypothetical protein
MSSGLHAVRAGRLPSSLNSIAPRATLWEEDALMALRIELTPEEEARLRERARQLGEQPETLAVTMLRSLLAPPVNGSATGLAPVVDDMGIFHQDRWDQVLASIAAGSASAPAIPPEALTREALYSDHD